MNKLTTLFVMVFVLVSITTMSATWCDTDYAKRIDINVNNTAGGALTDYQVYVNLSSNPINDTSIRVYNASDCTLRAHWCENITDGNCTKLWINYSVIAASTWTNNTAIYHNNASASSTSSGTNTFEFFDGFEDGTHEGEDGLVSNFGNWVRNRASYIVGNHAYVTETNGLHVVNISDIENPSVVGYVALGTQTLDIEVDGNYAYVSVLVTNKLSVVNISNSTNPVEVGNVTDATKLNEIHGVNKSGDYIYCCAYAAGGANGYLTIVNVSDPTNPTIEGWVANNASNYIKGSHDVRVIGNYAYLIASDHHVNNDGRLTIINVSNKSAPFVVSSITGTEFERSADIQIKGNYAFFGQWGYPAGAPANRYFRVVNISDVNNPFLAGGLAGYNMYVGYIQDNLIWCVDNRYDYLTVINISTPTSPTFVKQYTIPGSTAVLHVFLTEDGNYAVVARYNDGANDKFYIINTSVTPDTEWITAESETGDTASATTKKLVMEKGGTTGLFVLTKDTSSQLSSKRFWDFLVEYPTGKRTELLLNGDNVNPNSGAIHLIFNTDGVRYYNGSYHTICTMDADTEYKISIVPDVSADTFDIYVYHSNGTEVSYSGGHTSLNFRNVATYLNQWGLKQYSANTDKGSYDNFLVRKYASPEPSATLGSEEQQYATTPVISNVLNGSISATSQWIDWDVNQSAHNRVLYWYAVQEDANTYTCSNNWSITYPCTNTYDGNWNTYGKANSSQIAYVYFNYTIPTNANQSYSKWHVKNGGPEHNMTIPIECWNDPLYLRIESNMVAMPQTIWYCHNGSDWVQIVGGSDSIYEEQMKWALWSDWDNSTNAPNITLSSLTASTQYWYQAESHNTSNTSLYDNSSTMSFTTAGADTSFTVTLPSGHTYLKFGPSNSTAQNVTPNGQTDSQEFFNVTNTGAVNLDVRLQLNATVTNIVLKADNDNNPVGAKEVNTTLVTLYSGLTTTNSVDIWLWSDFSHAVEQDTNKTISINVTQSA